MFTTRVRSESCVFQLPLTSLCMRSWASTCTCSTVTFIRSHAHIHLRCQCYRWEFFTSFAFDWQYISGKKKFKWPLVSSSLTLLSH